MPGLIPDFGPSRDKRGLYFPAPDAQTRKGAFHEFLRALRGARSIVHGAALVGMLWLLSCATTAIAATSYYVSPSGSDTNPGTSALPFKTLQKGANVALPGDTVIAMDGVYTSAGDRVLQISRGGTASSPITFRAQNKWGAVIDGQNYTTAYGVVFASSYVNFTGFQVRNTKMAGLWLQANSTTVQVHHINISENWVHHIARIMISDCTDGYGRVGAYTNPYVHHVVWNRNLIHDIGRIPNPACDLLPYSQNHNYRHDHGLYLQGKYHTVSNNIFYNMYAGWAIKVDGYFLNLASTTDSSHVIVNNTFAYPANPGPTASGHIRLFTNYPPDVSSTGDVMQPPVNVVIANNISYEPPSAGGDTFVSALYDGVMPYAGTIARNNVTTAGSVIEESYGGTAITSTVALSGNQRSTDPLFKDAASVDLHLSALSPAIGAADSTLAPTSDFDGNPRPSASPDVGAREHSTPLLIVSPIDGSTVFGTLSVQISSSVSINSASVNVDGGAMVLDASSMAVTLDTSKLSNGAHALLATATDSTGKEYTSGRVTFNVANATTPSTGTVDTTAPTVTITNPAPGARLRGKVTITANASDNVGIAMLSLSIDGKLVSTANGGSLTYNWQTNKVSSGTHSISATTRDAAGNAASTSINVTK